MSGAVSDPILATALLDAWRAAEPTATAYVLVLGARIELLQRLLMHSGAAVQTVRRPNDRSRA